MLKRKIIRQRGKVPMAKFFQKFNSGDSVAIVREVGQQDFSFFNRFQGKTGKIIEKRGAAYVVEVNDYNMKKYLSLRPVHLKKIEVTKK